MTGSITWNSFHMRNVKTLIDECITKCGSQKALAEKIGIEQPDIQRMASGKRPVSPVTVGLLCDVLELPGSEASRLAVLAIIETAKPEKRGVLRRAFFRVVESWREIWRAPVRGEQRSGEDRRRDARH